MKNIFNPSSGKESEHNSIEGWNNLNWGMTEEEIKKEFEGQVERLSEPTAFAGRYANLTIRNIDIGGNQLEALFQMGVETNGLGQILLQPVRKPSQKNFSEVEKNLIQWYGTPHHTVNEEEGNYQNYKRTWQLTTTTIELHFIDFGLPKDSIETMKMMTLLYRPNKEGEVMTDFSKNDIDRKWSQEEIEKLSEKDITKLAFRRNLKNIIFFGIQAVVVLFLVDKIGKLGIVLGWISIGVLLIPIIEMLIAISTSLIALIPSLFVASSGVVWRLLQLLIALCSFLIFAALAISIYLKMY